MTTGKNKKQFKEWLKIIYVKNLHFKNIHDVIGFENLPFEMQIGVYLAYYDGLGVEIMVKSWRQSKNVFIYSVNELYKESCYSNDEDKIFNTRNEAYKEAFLKADELINQK